MPSLRMQTFDGYTLTCDSSNPDTVAAWLVEMTQRYVSASTSDMPLRLYIYPVWTRDGKPDWPINDQSYMVSATPDEFLTTLIEKLQEAANARAAL